MRGLTLMLALVSTAMLGGCTHWTGYGNGGAAEELPESAIPVDAGDQSPSHYELQQDFNHSRQQLEVLILRGAERCFPASVYTASLQRNRVARELAGGLVMDAETSLLDLRIELHRLERKIIGLNNADFCWPDRESAQVAEKDAMNSATQESRIDLSGLYRLLNSDNQFVRDSYQLNPKYRQNLTTACALLNQHTDLGISVTGHADASGNSEYNGRLSARRAMAVMDFFIDCGIESSRIELLFEGDTQPRYAGRSPEADLVNRRVSIELDSAQPRPMP